MLEAESGNMRASVIANDSADLGASLPSKPSPWLYGASLAATLSAVYAVDFVVDQASFTMLTFVTALLGYAASYTIRKRQIDTRPLQLPVLIAITIGLVALALSDAGFASLVPEEIRNDRARVPQLLFMWMTIIISFTLNTDAALLFLCVPAMTCIALVASSVPDPAILNAFVLFVGAVAFMMIHENYLRSQADRTVELSPEVERRYFTGQLQIAGLCVIGSVVLAQVVAVPLRLLGVSVSASSRMDPLAGPSQQTSNSTSTATLVSDQNKIDISTGPVTASHKPLILVDSNEDAYLRGSSYDSYDGRSFSKTRPAPAAALAPDLGTLPPLRTGYQLGANMQMQPPVRYKFTIPVDETELSAEAQRDSHLLTQHLRIIGGNFTQLVTAGTPVSIITTLPRLLRSQGGGLNTENIIQSSGEFDVVSRMVTPDAEKLKSASADPARLPAPIAKYYLPIANIPTLKQYADQIVLGKTNNYDKVTALKEAIVNQCKYSIQAERAPAGTDVVENFLFNSKVGYCDVFGAALTVLCRLEGIPARVVNGFLPGDRDRKGLHIVLEKDRHIWTEVFFPDYGWVTFDATEGTQDISDYSDENGQKRGFIAWLRSRGAAGMLIASTLVVLGAIIFFNELWPRLKRRKANKVARIADLRDAEASALYRRICRVFAKRGTPRDPAMTNEQFASLVKSKFSGTHAELVTQFARFTGLVNHVRYGRLPSEDSSIATLKSLATELSRAIRRLPKR